MQISETTCLWYGPFRTQSIRVILDRDPHPRTRDGDDRGYGLPLITTDLLSPAEDLIATATRQIHLHSGHSSPGPL